MSHPLYAELILPLALGHTFTYAIPEELRDQIQPGIRVEVNFGRRRHYAGIVHSVHSQTNKKKNTKDIIAVLDQSPVIHEKQLRFWEWISSYYMCHLGEVMSAALPPAMKLSSETRVIASQIFLETPDDELSEFEYKIKQYLIVKHEMNMDDIATVLQLKSTHQWVQQMVDKNFLFVFEALDPVVSEKKKEIILLDPAISASTDLQKESFDQLSRSKHQTNALMGILFLQSQHRFVIWDMLKKRFDVPRSAIKSLEKKGLIKLKEIGLSEMMENNIQSQLSPLSAEQTEAYTELQKSWDTHDVLLLHGVTGSGKTHIYAHKMKEILEGNKHSQILFLLPEIALTNMTLLRLQKLFGSEVMVYHSRLTPKERMTCWNKVLRGQRLIVGPRSALYLPFQNLSLVVIDESHDPSFVELNRKPHYNGRDVAIVMAKQQGAKVILGSATPAIETLWKAYHGKFAYIRLKSRFGNVQLPKVELIDLKKARKEKTMTGSFSHALIEAITSTLEQKKQVLLFQNRKGHSPVYLCPVCQWKAVCSNCDVSLTYHQYFHRLVCHLCNFSYTAVEQCPECGSSQIEKIGLGTERIEQEIKELFPKSQVARLDSETGSRKYATHEILEDFQNHKTDILVGTQMITKGLDFDNIGLVGVVLADGLLHFPEYRAMERAFQLMMQVSGRAGRRKDQGLVLIQTFSAEHPVFRDIRKHDYLSFAQRELTERKNFIYPPFCRMIKIELRHKNPDLVLRAAEHLARNLRQHLKNGIKGPAQPGIARIRNQYIQHVVVKMHPDQQKIKQIKQHILEQITEIRKGKGLSSLRVDLFIDP